MTETKTTCAGCARAARIFDSACAVHGDARASAYAFDATGRVVKNRYGRIESSAAQWSPYPHGNEAS